MEIITYSLLNDQKRSDPYYRDIAAFSDEVLAEAERRFSPLLEAFQECTVRTTGNTHGARLERVFELLTLGTLWHVYAGQIPKISPTWQRLFSWLVALREKGGLIKAAADFVRGMLTTLFLKPKQAYPCADESPTLADMEKLLKWLQATGEFDEEVRRLNIWQEFLNGQPKEHVLCYLKEFLAFADWFERRSEAALGSYTPNVEKFLAEIHPSYRWREDSTFCGRQRVEYHLNMVGTELLNRAFRSAFLATPRKIVIVPPCMRIQPEQKCEAKQISFGALCQSCTPACRVNQLTKLGQKHGFQVLIMPDELSVFSTGTDQNHKGDGVGVVGVACALTNAPGGWKTERLGVPAQGVLLEYCGCSYHWHKKGIPTDVNFRKVLEVVGIQKPDKDDSS